MTIYNGPSIYNQGGGGSGGGGAYSDGGALVDGDFIKVENNTISTYDNTARSDINYYFEVAENEIINAVVELTTTVNATVHVYIVQNGLYIPLGNIGGDTVNAGDEYKVNITGDSFAIEQVTGGGADPEAAVIGSHVYSVLKNGGLLWTCSDLHEQQFSYRLNNDRYYYLPNVDLNINGWRLPTNTEFQALVSAFGMNALKTTTGWGGYSGTNTSGMGLNAFGAYNINSNIVELDNWRMYYMIVQGGQAAAVTAQANDSPSYGTTITNYGVPVRLVKEYP